VKRSGTSPGHKLAAKHVLGLLSEDNIVVQADVRSE
jgi:hypothetical protein